MKSMKNNFIFAPVKLGFCKEKDGIINERHIAFYNARSEHLGAVTLEPLYLKKSLREIPTQIGIDDDGKIPGLSKLIQEIHKFDTKVIAHLNHPGRMANPKIPGNEYISSTDKPCESGGANPIRMGKTEMDSVVDTFVAGALRAEKAGFDYIEIQSGHGYLLAQFLSNDVNDRDDEFGGDLENRMRFPLRVIEEVKKNIKIPLIVRLSGSEMTPNGISIEETVLYGNKLKDLGVSAVHISAGTVCSTPPWYFQHMFVPKGKTWELASVVKQKTGMPVIFVGRINTPEDLDKVSGEFKADFIALGRPLVADPDFIGKYLGKIPGTIRPCLSCLDGCLGGVKAGKGLGCMVNPRVGKEGETVPPVAKAKKVAVIGGGLSGIEAALELKRRGHNPVIFEKNELGGQFNLAHLPPGKASLKKILEYHKKEIDRLGIPIENKEIKPEDFNTQIEEKFDSAVIATGSVPAVPPIEGLNQYYWAEVLKDKNQIKGKTVLVIGGGLIGIEAAHKLDKLGNKVYIVEMLEEIARGMEAIEKKLTLKNLKESGVEIYTSAQVAKVEEKDGKFRVLIKIKGDTKEKTIENIDHIILSAGMKSYNPFGEMKTNIETCIVGDAKTVGKAENAITSGYECGKQIG